MYPLYKVITMFLASIHLPRSLRHQSPPSHPIPQRCLTASNILFLQKSCKLLKIEKHGATRFLQANGWLWTPLGEESCNGS
jgi:hypothetical protein